MDGLTLFSIQVLKQIEMLMVCSLAQTLFSYLYVNEYKNENVCKITWANINPVTVLWHSLKKCVHID